jgi:putative ABC transport system substrate-binding protein
MLRIRRREFITLLGGAATMPIDAWAQQPGRMRRVTVWVARANDGEGLRLASAFRQELQARGWADGRNIRTDYRWVTRDIDRVQLAKEIVEQQSDVIVVESTPGVAAVTSQSRTVPVIFVSVSDPIGSGFVASLARPGGSITGFMSNEPTLASKWVELLKEIAFGVQRLGFLFNPDTAPYAEAFLHEAETAGFSLGVKVIASPVHNDSEIERTMAELASQPTGGLIVLPEATTNAGTDFIIMMAARYRLPAIYAFRYQAVAGGLVSYGVDLATLFRGAAIYVDRILRGEKPADLPVQAPTRFELIINLKTARALGLSVSADMRSIADEVIE